MARVLSTVEVALRHNALLCEQEPCRLCDIQAELLTEQHNRSEFGVAPPRYAVDAFPQQQSPRFAS
jgi:hypothetical protein